MLKFAIVIFGVVAVAQAQRGTARARAGDEPATTPVPILRQINDVNEDGSYTYGYEAADGSYKIETKSKNGEVKGKYGYYDDSGVLREIEYGASRQGFHPQGTDVKPPESAPAMAYNENDDTGFYDPELYEKPFAYDPFAQGTQPRRPAAAGRRPGGRRPKQQQFAQQQFAQQFNSAPQQQYQPQPQYQQQSQYQPQNEHVVNYQHAPAAPAPAPVQQNYYQPQAPQVPYFNPAQLFHGHPAKNIDINTGSYSVNYSG